MQDGNKACASFSADKLNMMFRAALASASLLPSFPLTITALQALNAPLRSRCREQEGWNLDRLLQNEVQEKTAYESCCTHARAFFAVASGQLQHAFSRSDSACGCAQMLKLPPHLAMAASTVAHAPMTLLLPVPSFSHSWTMLPPLLLALCNKSHMALQLPAANMTSAQAGAVLRQVSQKRIEGVRGSAARPAEGCERLRHCCSDGVG
jgi:hypothetical protein